MSTELVKSSQKYLATRDGIRKDAGKSLMLVGGGGLGTAFIAGMLPFVSLPMLLVVMVLGGGYLAIKD